ncbi:branched-chain amino acid ABC transporter permease [Gemmobacter sp.]|uniref:branched-chain amino acid ABC transporter permease n=1 Tax=Gemmobacter sp. TaxID=1898957 RepID=UPI002AFF8AF3|nr:branched-chain amino acid ABC transporter permease [Gemmobacter sp.]
MQYFIELTTSGLVIGSIYGLMAMAFAVVYRATGLLNFAQGEMGMLTAYIAWSINSSLGPSPFLLIACVVVVSMLIGLMIERLIMRRMLGEPMFSAVLVTIGVGVVIQSLVLMIWGGDAKFVDIGMADSWVTVFGARLRTSQAAVIVTLFAFLLIAWAVVRFSRFGIAMRAVAEDQRTARLMGISPQKVQAVAWAVSTLLAALAGTFFAVIFQLSPTLFALGLKAFPAAILGGFDAIIGAGAAGPIIGITENLVGGYVSPLLKEIAGFLTIVIVLMVRPFGLFGQRHIERV